MNANTVIRQYMEHHESVVSQYEAEIERLKDSIEKIKKAIEIQIEGGCHADVYKDGYDDGLREALRILERGLNDYQDNRVVLIDNGDVCNRLCNRENGKEKQ